MRYAGLGAEAGPSGTGLLLPLVCVVEEPRSGGLVRTLLTFHFSITVLTGF